MDPVTGMIVASAVSKGLGALGGALTRRGDAKKTAAENQKDRDAQRQRDLLDTASQENQANPFRHTLDQLAAAEAFDKIQNTRQKTVSIPGLNPKFMPKLGGGYQASDELRGAAGTARTAVLGGQGQAPTMTNAANYGQTGVMDLLAMLQRAGMIPPGAGMPQAGMPGTPPGGDMGFAAMPGRRPNAEDMGFVAPPSGRPKLKDAGFAGDVGQRLRVASQRGSRPRVGTQPASDPFALSF